MKKIKLAFISIAALVGIMTVLPVASSYVGASPASQIRGGVDQAGGGGQTSNLGSRIKIIVNILLYILGAIAVVMIVIGGIRYTTSNGDSGSIKSAKDTILYAVIGLIVAILAYSIVNFVLAQF